MVKEGLGKAEKAFQESLELRFLRGQRATQRADLMEQERLQAILAPFNLSLSLFGC